MAEKGCRKRSETTKKPEAGVGGGGAGRMQPHAMTGATKVGMTE